VIWSVVSREALYRLRRNMVINSRRVPEPAGDPHWALRRLDQRLWACPCGVSARWA